MDDDKLKEKIARTEEETDESVCRGGTRYITPKARS